MSRFYVRPEDIKNNEIHVAGDEAHHILDVMRLKKGDSVLAFDGLGNEYIGVIDKTEKKSLVISIQSKNKQPSPNTKITLAQSIPKSEKMDYIVRKATELGVHCIIPMITERTVVKLSKDRETKRRTRWTKITKEAAKQCGRSDVPEIKNISDFKNVLETSKNYSLKIMPTLIGERRNIVELASSHKNGNVIVFIGPEGGFSLEEVELARNSGFSPVVLNRYTLKTDTAAIAALSILNAVLNINA